MDTTGGSRHPSMRGAIIAVTGALALVTALSGMVLVAAPAQAKTKTKPSVVISGDFKVKGVVARCGQLQKSAPPTASTTIFFGAAPGTKAGPTGGYYELDLQNVPLGATTTFPVPAGTNPRSVRFSYQTNSDYLDWTAPSSGTVAWKGDGMSGKLDLTIPFSGDDNHTVPPTAHQPITIKGAFTCKA